VFVLPFISNSRTNPVERAARLLYRMRSIFLGGLHASLEAFSVKVEPAPVLVKQETAARDAGEYDFQ
jgi:hypothetical protein